MDTVRSELPNEMTLGGETFDNLIFLQGDEESVLGHTMVERAKEMNAHNGKSERDYILAYQDEIPPALRGEVVFVFTDDPHPDNPESVHYVYWSKDNDRWVEKWIWLDCQWDGKYRVPRHRS